MRLYGKEWSRRELEARVGRIEQIGGVRRLKHTEGPEAGTEWIEMRTGSGLTYALTPAKGFDISLTEWRGVPLSWQAGNGEAAPAMYDAEGSEWLRTASGGLLMTCGLTHVGAPLQNKLGQRFGLHGRVHHTPARHVRAWTEWEGDELLLRAAGVIEETAIFGSKLRLTREVSSRLGEASICITDKVENIGFQEAPHRIMYHFNFGFPLLDEHTLLHLPAADTRAAIAGTPLDNYDRWEAPDPQMAERVYYHDVHRSKVDAQGMSEVLLQQPSFPSAEGGQPLQVRLRWRADTLPRLVQWRMPGAGEHVLGLEPTNSGVAGEQESGVQLQPGESVTYSLELHVTEKLD